MPPKTLSKRYLETHRCEVPDTLPDEPDEPSSPMDVDPDPAMVPRSPSATIVEPVTATQTCPSVIQSGLNQGKICGKPVFAGGLCRRHHTLSSEERPSKKARLTEPLEGRCKCKTQKGFFCGAAVKDGGMYCKRHVNCLAVVGGVQPEPAPEVIVIDAEREDPQDVRLQQEPEVVIVEDAPSEPVVDEPVPPVPPIEAELFQRAEWTTHFVSDTTALMSALQEIEVVDLDAQQFEALEANIRACFA